MPSREKQYILLLQQKCTFLLHFMYISLIAISHSHWYKSTFWTNKSWINWAIHEPRWKQWIRKYWIMSILWFIFNNTESKNELQVLHTNIVSLRKSFKKLEQLFLGMDTLPDIIALTETRLQINKHKNVKIPKIPGFKFKRKDSISRAGGVGFYVRTSINCEIRHDLNLNVNDTEDLWLEITTEKHKKSLCCCNLPSPST